MCLCSSCPPVLPIFSAKLLLLCCAVLLCAPPMQLCFCPPLFLLSYPLPYFCAPLAQGLVLLCSSCPLLYSFFCCDDVHVFSLVLLCSCPLLFLCFSPAVLLCSSFVVLFCSPCAPVCLLCSWFSCAPMLHLFSVLYCAPPPAVLWLCSCVSSSSCAPPLLFSYAPPVILSSVLLFISLELLEAVLTAAGCFVRHHAN